MATVINNPSDNGSGAGTVIGILVALILVALLFIYGLPALRGGASTGTPNTTPGASANIDVNLPTSGGANVDAGAGQ